MFTTFGQLVIKAGVDKLGAIQSSGFHSTFQYFVKAIGNIWIISGLFSALLAAFCWMAALSKFELSSVYPFQSINFILVPVLSVLLFQESFNLYKAAGVLIIVFGIFVFSRGI